MNRKRARLGYRPSLLKRRDREGGKERDDKRNPEVSSNPKPLPSTEHRTDADGRERPLMNDRRTASSSSPSLSWTDGRTRRGGTKVDRQSAIQGHQCIPSPPLLAAGRSLARQSFESLGQHSDFKSSADYIQLPFFIPR